MTARRVAPPVVDDVRRAGEIIARHLPTTPVLASPLLGPNVILKLETLQPTGSFKVRGALAALAAARHADPQRPVVTASAGNHGLGVAFAAQTFEMRAIIVVPENASPAKQKALEGFDVDIIRHGLSYDEAESHALHLAEAGARFVSAYNDPDVISGQGTIALELFDQVPDLTTIVVPVGGGGLLAGVALAAGLRPGSHPAEDDRGTCASSSSIRSGKRRVDWDACYAPAGLKMRFSSPSFYAALRGNRRSLRFLLLVALRSCGQFS